VRKTEGVVVEAVILLVVFGKRVACRSSLVLLARSEDLPGMRLVGLAHRDDAVCINQQDLNERSAQVLKMSGIYRSASPVLVWLGESENESDLLSNS
jgi:hypothetical protein